MKVLVLPHSTPFERYLPAFEAAGIDMEPLAWTRDLADAELADVEAVLGWQFPSGVAGRLPRLRWVCAVSAGVEKLLAPDLAPHVPVSRIVDREQGRGIAQFVAMMALRHARHLPLYEAQQRDRQWLRVPVDMARNPVAVLGMGEMGRAVAEMLRAVGFEVLGWSRSGGGSLAEVLGAADIVVCALPLTPETDGLLNAERFAQMRRGAYLINIARGAHVVDADLIAAVKSGQLAGAALDVQRREPLPAEDPLWAVPGITITPHIASQSSPETIAAQFIEGLKRLQRGEPLLNVVDKVRGY